MDESRLSKRILRANFDAIGDVRVRCLRDHGVRRVNLAQVDGKAYVLELNPKLRNIRALVRAATTAAEHGLSVARLLGSDTSLMALCRYGTAYAIFEYVDGRHPSYDCPMADITGIAAMYAELHSVTRSLPGIGASDGWNLDEYLAAWNTVVIHVGSASELPKWLLRNRPPDPETYQLVHGDANRSNSIFKSDGQLVLIDLGDLHFGFPPFELVYLLLYYCGNDAVRRKRFIDVYRKRLGELFDTWERHAAFWLVGGLMERAHWRIRSAKDDRSHRNDSAATKRIHDAKAAVDRATRVANLFPDGRGELQEVLVHCWESY